MQYNAKIYLNDGNGRTEVYNAKIEFVHDPNQYGNGYSMGIESKLEPFYRQGYDIRYDRDFNKDYPIEYIVTFYSRRFNGKNGAWKLIGIRVHEAEFEEEGDQS